MENTIDDYDPLWDVLEELLLILKHKLQTLDNHSLEAIKIFKSKQSDLWNLQIDIKNPHQENQYSTNWNIESKFFKILAKCPQSTSAKHVNNYVILVHF